MPSDRSAAIESIGDLRRFVDAIPFNHLLGLRLKQVHADGVTLECRLRPELLNASGVVHGGVTATLADAAAGIALTRHLRRARAATTVELKINYLRAVTGDRLRARARLLRVGSTICCARVDVFDSARELAATALVTYMMLKG